MAVTIYEILKAIVDGELRRGDGEIVIGMDRYRYSAYKLTSAVGDPIARIDIKLHKLTP